MVHTRGVAVEHRRIDQMEFADVVQCPLLSGCVRLSGPLSTVIVVAVSTQWRYVGLLEVAVRTHLTS